MQGRAWGCDCLCGRCVDLLQYGFHVGFGNFEGPEACSCPTASLGQTGVDLALEDILCSDKGNQSGDGA